MDHLEQLSMRLDRVESRFAISELVSAYALACDEHDLPRLTSLFDEHAEFTSKNGMMEAKGRAAIVDMFIGMLRVRGPGYHWTHDHFVQFDAADPDRAIGIVLAHAETCPNGEVSVAAMRYHDEYIRSNGAWRFSKREINFLYYVPQRDYATCLSSKYRFTVNGERKEADYPESLACWQDFHRKYVEPV